MSSLLPPLKQHLREDLDEVTEERIWRNVRARGAQAAMNRRRRAWVVSGMAAAAGIVLWARGQTHVSLDARTESPAVAALAPAAGPLRLQDGTPLHSAHAEGADIQLVASEGTHIALAHGATLEVLSNGGGEVRLRQPEGRVAYDITPGGPRRWTIESGPVVVEVVGTNFVVTHDEHHVQVDVSRGHVVVRGEGVEHGVADLLAGGHVDVPLRSAESRLAEAAPEARPTKDAPKPRRLDVVPAPVEKLSAPEPAPAAVSSRVQAPPVGELMAKADAARLSPHSGDAIAPLEQLLEAYPKDAHAPLAAFTLAQMYLRAGEGIKAKAAFDAALAGELPNALREQARRGHEAAVLLPLAVQVSGRSRSDVAVDARRCPHSAWSTEKWIFSMRVELAAENETIVPHGAATAAKQLSAVAGDCSNPDRVEVVATQGTRSTRRTVDLADVAERDRERVLAIVASDLMASVRH